MEDQFSNYQQKIGILVTNLGTPDSPSKKKSTEISKSIFNG
jgi:hypothetical protein